MSSNECECNREPCVCLISKVTEDKEYSCDCRMGNVNLSCSVCPALLRQEYLNAEYVNGDVPTKLFASKDKLRYDLIPIDAIEEVVRVFMFGAEKYEAWDWYKNPLPWSTYHNASYRHGISMWRHEDIDVESGLHTLAHKIASDIILLTYQLKGIGEDDRI